MDSLEPPVHSLDCPKPCGLNHPHALTVFLPPMKGSFRDREAPALLRYRLAVRYGARAFLNFPVICLAATYPDQFLWVFITVRSLLQYVVRH